jgi:hypothetical protein
VELELVLLEGDVANISQEMSYFTSDKKVEIVLRSNLIKSAELSVL